MREFVTSANLITSGNLTAGFLALVAAQADRLTLAAGLIAVAGVLDSLDGPLARRNGSDGAFGTNLDSLADLVSFGVAPMAALYFGLLHRLPVLGLVACLGFVLCGAWRLARFPLIKSSRRFVGLPIPPTGVLVAALAAWGPSPAPMLVVTVVLSVLMVSPFPFPTLSAAGAGVVSLSRGLTRGRFPADGYRAGKSRQREDPGRTEDLGKTAGLGKTADLGNSPNLGKSREAGKTADLGKSPEPGKGVRAGRRARRVRVRRPG